MDAQPTAAAIPERPAQRSRGSWSVLRHIRRNLSAIGPAEPATRGDAGAVPSTMQSGLPNGAAIAPAPPGSPLQSHSLTEASTIWRLLERNHGTQGSDMPEVRLLRLSWLLGQALQRHTNSRWERLPPRAVLFRDHPEAFIDVRELKALATQCEIRQHGRAPPPSSVECSATRALAISRSRDWESGDHRGQCADASSQSYRRSKSSNVSSRRPAREMGVYLPWCSLPQRIRAEAGWRRSAALLLARSRRLRCGTCTG